MDRQLHTRLVQKQWGGVVTRAQLVAAGITVAAVDSALRRGELRLLHRGVYAVGGAPLRDEGVWLAAVLACGPGAVLSHLSAARLWGMRTPRGDDRPHVTLAAGQRRPHGIVVHRTRRITKADTTVHRGVPTTTVPRDASPLPRGPPRAAAHQLQGPRHRARLRLAHRVIVETDGGAFHAPKPARERDYERTAALVAAGWTVLRFTHDQVIDEPALVAARIAAVLTAAAAA